LLDMTALGTGLKPIQTRIAVYLTKSPRRVQREPVPKCS
jgi:hypothetical protein